MRTPTTTPPHVAAYRAVIAAVTLLLLAAAGLGLAGYGPFTPLHGVASPVYHVLHLDRIGG
jgi:hypothetical protein